MEHKNYIGFLRNKYYVWYDSIIMKALNENRKYNSEMHEFHHVLPRSLGGKETVCLTFKEHYICHWLLTKFTVGADRHKMIMAMSFFYYNKINKSAKRPLNANKSRSYENFKNIFVQVQKERFADPTINPFYKSDTFKFRNTLSGEIFEYTRYDAVRLTDLSANEVSRLISRGITKKLKTSSKNWDIFVPSLGIFSSEIEKRKNNTMIKSINKKICEHCNKTVNVGNYNRWHGKNCKFKY